MQGDEHLGYQGPTCTILLSCGCCCPSIRNKKQPAATSIWKNVHTIKDCKAIYIDYQYNYWKRRKKRTQRRCLSDNPRITLFDPLNTKLTNCSRNNTDWQSCLICNSQHATLHCDVILQKTILNMKT